ncbi:zygote arrest protein 1-like [Pomacea canaliculata]|uniref:zygote arrest protein 1-like n=1 Tax=Pomacea canaliculata TaxID=400727 RepID=UPI000D73BD2E|nr:zygote arrest protein 1-like [Pomacea canaliculata]
MSYRGKKRRGEQRRYGFFHCDICDLDWESSHVYVAYGTDDALYEQECKNCGTAYYPDYVERLRCRDCQEVDCTCSDKERHVDPFKPHLEEHCLRCRSGRRCVPKRYR